ncbi:UDP-N-acetylglucosamine 1-carboxyvinyltransferase [Cutibacterium acnes JCM 18909]|nr:UDP-N-acetylglucosamine 1-carboxyvinyltransferase [Cutibacterium acnes JCM 18909]
MLDLGKLGADVQLLDPHRLIVRGPTRWRGRELICAGLASCRLSAIGRSGRFGRDDLRDVYMINRGYEDLPTRLGALGAKITVFHG